MMLHTQLHQKVAEMKATSGVLPDEGERLAYLAAEAAKNNERGVIVEIGSCQGRSAAYMAAALSQGSKTRIFCVDLWVLGDGKTPERHHKISGYMRFISNIRSLGLIGYVIPIMSDSVSLAPHWTLPIDLLFIDGGHKYEEVLADYEGWGRFVKPGGVIAFHDYNADEIKRMVDEFLDLEKDWEFLGLTGRVWSARRKDSILRIPEKQREPFVKRNTRRA